jgi:hypothetical protein
MPDLHDRLEPAPEFGAALRALPLVAPPTSALPGLLAELSARRRRRAAVWLAPLAAAALLVLALRPSNAPVPAPVPVAAAVASPELSRLMQANALLEGRLASARGAHITQDGDAAQASAQMEDMLVLVDAALGSNPEPTQRVRLWERRLELLQALTQVQSRGSLAAPEGENGRVVLASF